jgi:hypothetical protein
MENLYLILHKVRGKAAYDVAERVSLDGKEWFVLCTVGARAYPVKTWSLSELLHLYSLYREGLTVPIDLSSVQDFYEVSPADWSKLRAKDLATIDERAEEARERLDFLSSLAPAAPAVSIITRRLKA